MKKLLFFCIIFILLNCSLKDQLQQPLKIVELDGTAYHRGLVHGKILKQEIKQIITQWSYMTEVKYKLKMEDIKNDFLNKTHYMESIKKWTPDLIDEIKGIADGSGIDHAKAQNYIIGGKDNAICIECDSEEIFKFNPEENTNLTYHTNHYLAADYESKYCSRLTTLKEELMKRNFEIGYEDIKAILSSRKYNAGRPISHYNTYGCTIMILSDKPELHIAPGRPDITEFLTFNFEN